MKPTFILTLLASCVIGWAVCSTPVAAAIPEVEQVTPSSPGTQRPNVLFILTDDQAPWALGHAVRSGLETGVPAASTPNLDQLAADGVSLNRCFCTNPVCSPARVSLLTGQYASRFGVTDFIPSVDHRLYDPNDQQQLEPTACVTLVEQFRRAGYRTGLIGKMHVGDWTQPGRQRFHPTRYGYEHFTGFLSGGGPAVDPTLEHRGQLDTFSGLTTDVLTGHAVDFLDDAAAGDQPFFLSFHTRAPHAPWLPVAPQDWEPYEDSEMTLPSYDGLDVDKLHGMMREYLASVSGVDRGIGRLLDRLRHHGLESNTIVVFTSDHGYNMGHHGIWHKGNGIWATKPAPPGRTHQGTAVIDRRYRPNLFDQSLRVPAIVRWPGRIAPSTTVDATVTHMDWYATLCSMAGIDAPDVPPTSRDASGWMTGHPPERWEDDLYAEYPHGAVRQSGPCMLPNPDS